MEQGEHAYAGSEFGIVYIEIYLSRLKNHDAAAYRNYLHVTEEQFQEIRNSGAKWTVIIYIIAQWILNEYIIERCNIIWMYVYQLINNPLILVL